MPESEDILIGDLIDETTNSISQLISFAGGSEDEQVRGAARQIVGDVIAECLGIIPSCMDAPDVLRRSVSDYRGGDGS
jgi:hypothetical protein